MKVGCEHTLRGRAPALVRLREGPQIIHGLREAHYLPQVLHQAVLLARRLTSLIVRRMAEQAKDGREDEVGGGM